MRPSSPAFADDRKGSPGILGDPGVVLGDSGLISYIRPRAIQTTSNTPYHAGSISLPFLERFGSVHAARLKQQGRRFPLFIFEILTSTRRLRVSGFGVAQE